MLYLYSVKLGQRASSPKFVVTLDGAGSESLTEMDTIDAVDSLLATSSASATRNVVRVKPQTQPLTTLTQGSNPRLLCLLTYLCTLRHVSSRFELILVTLLLLHTIYQCFSTGVPRNVRVPLMV